MAAMTKHEMKLYAEAACLADSAMGRERVKYPRDGEPRYRSRAADDPLAWWCLTEAIVRIAKRYRKIQSATCAS